MGLEEPEISDPDQVARWLELIRDISFPKQDAFVTDPARFLSALCTRRAGKTNGLALRFFRTAQKYPRALLPYIALTRDSAKNIMWGILQELDDKYKIGAKFTESDLTVTLPNEAKIKLFGADMENFIKRLRGIKSPGAAIDEAQDFGAHIVSLVDDVLTPAISDYPDGWLALTGTPGKIPLGLFHEITGEGKYGYSRHEWGLYENPYLPNARQFVAEIKAKKQWADDHPTYQREYLGKWVMDLEALVFKYKPDQNHYDSLPDMGRGWEYVIGVDLGFDDSDAIAVIGWHPRIKEAYLVYEHVAAKQGITELANQIGALIGKYDPLKVVMDTGGLGKKIAEEMQRRYSLPVEAAEKDRKLEYIEIMNDALRLRRFYAKKTSHFAYDCARVKWDRESIKPKISEDFHSDITDAALYAYREALHWLHVPELERPAPGTGDWLKEQEDAMEEAAEAMARGDQEDDLWGDLKSQGLEPL